MNATVGALNVRMSLDSAQFQAGTRQACLAEASLLEGMALHSARKNADKCPNYANRLVASLEADKRYALREVDRKVGTIDKKINQIKKRHLGGK